MNRKLFVLASAAIAISPMASAKASTPSPIVFPDAFDPIGSPVQSIVTDKGRRVHFTDTGEEGWKPVLFIGGAGTSARAPELVSFLDTMRRRLKIRLITVERNGLGDTAFDPSWTFDDYVTEVNQVLKKLEIDRFSLVAISGGGAYAGHITAAMPDKISSLHMLATVSTASRGGERCALDHGQLLEILKPQVQAPRIWWELPPTGVAAKVRGFADKAADEGARAFFIRGQMGDAHGMAAESRRFCETPTNVSAYKGPTYLYYGEHDPLTPPSHGEYWAAHVGGKVTFRRYPGEGHDVQYRHWDQLLLDVAGFGAQTLICEKGSSRLAPGQVDPKSLPKGQTIGLCAWNNANNNHSKR